MRKPWRIVTALGIAVLALGAWAAWRGLGSSGVTAHVTNSSNQNLGSVTIQYETCGQRSSVSIGELPPGKSRRLRYSVCGEGGYTVEAQFADGRLLHGGGGYVETGYISTDVISSDGISSQQSLY
jgi:hypothetical protein